MIRRRLFVTGTLAVWLVVLALVGKISIDRLSVPAWGNPIGDDRSAPVDGSSRVGQVFTAPFPGLYRIEIMLDTGSSPNPRQGTFHLATGPGAASDLEVATFDTRNLLEGGVLGIEFEPMRNSKEQPYYFFVESGAPTSDDAVTLAYGPQSILDGASAYLNGEPIAGNLEFRTYYSLRTREKLDVLLTRLAEGRPYFLGTKGFYIVLAVVYCAVLSAFLLFVAHRILDEGEGEA
jgi:hypothetical protein